MSSSSPSNKLQKKSGKPQPAAMNTGSARTAPPSSSATTDRPQPRSTTDKPQQTQPSPQAGQANNDKQVWTGCESHGESDLHNGNNIYGTVDGTISGTQTFSGTKSFDNSKTHNGNNIGLKAPNYHGKPPPQQFFQPPS
ncbi:uncharacterized protein K441DRAFT_668934 [Cenococcum geophilum 1.58]|uniref:uncharacterized protein n=1 Tax=Cenococcum geophilum 1.58 TaxID=794803 RepID=UPI00358F8431|nr:hypothetical protein K441DRAFT_668934 [Cenococcum geophilum 1.58]